MAMNEQALLTFAQNMIRNNRDKIPNTPWAQSAVNAIMNNDAKSGMGIADNLCNTYGMTREEALKAASQSIKFPQN